jgi:hypothetical protein
MATGKPNALLLGNIAKWSKLYESELEKADQNIKLSTD